MRTAYSCKYPKCKVKRTKYSTLPNKSFYQFPSDPLVFQEWAKICNITNPTRNFKICEDHFHPDYSFKSKIYLMPNALPLAKDVMDRLNSGTFTQNDTRLIFLDDSHEQTEDVYRWCLIPKCKNTQIDTPETHFFEIPAETVARREYLKSAGLDPDKFSPGSLHVCQRHFNLKIDLLNYNDWVKKKGTPKLKPGVVPHKFLNKQRQNTVRPWSAPQYGIIAVTALPVVFSAPAEVVIKEEPPEPDSEPSLTNPQDLSNFMVFCEEEIKPEIVEPQTQTVKKEHNYATENCDPIRNYTNDLYKKLKNLSDQNREKMMLQIDTLLYFVQQNDNTIK